MSDPPTPLQYAVVAEPIPRPVVEEVLQLLGYDRPTDVVQVLVEYGRVIVTTVTAGRGEVRDVVHSHVIT